MERFWGELRLAQLEFENSSLRRRIDSLTRMITELQNTIHQLEELTETNEIQKDLNYAEPIFEMED